MASVLSDQRIQSSMFDPSTNSGLPTNEQLRFLPPLPETPHLSRLSIEEDGLSTTLIRSSHTVTKGDPVRQTMEEERRLFGGIKRSTTQTNLAQTSPTIYPVLTTRQGGMNTPRMSPTKSTSPTKLLSAGPTTSRLVPALPIAQPDLSSVSTSFQMPAADQDSSLLGNCAPPSYTDDDSFDFRIDEMRPKSPRKPSVDHKTGSLSPSPSPSRSPINLHKHQSQLGDSFNGMLDQSAILPSSPSRSSYLLSSSTISTVQPPWSSETSPQKSFEQYKSPRTRQSPSHPIPPSKSKRTFPASSSGQSLAAVGEESEQQVGMGEMDISTLLPVSPAKMRHLLREEEMIQHEKMSFIDEDFSTTFPPPEEKRSVVSRTTTPRRKMEKQIMGDVTLDVKDLMAKMAKPKRASGTEESFVDLLHADGLDHMDETLGPDESFLPTNLRPTRHTSGSMSPRKVTQVVSRASSTRTFHSPQNQKSVGGLPSSASLRHLDGRAPESSRRSRRRSKSLSEADPTSTEVPTTFRKLASPEKVIRGAPSALPSSYSSRHLDIQCPESSRRSRRRSKSLSEAEQATEVPTSFRKLQSPEKITRTTATPCSRPSVAAPSTSRRISLSVGAVPMPTNASHRVMELPRSRTQSGLDALRQAVPAVQPKIRSPMTPAVTTTSSLGPRARVGTTSSIRPSGLTRPTTSSTTALRLTSADLQIESKRDATRIGPGLPSSHLTRTTSSSRPRGLPLPSTSRSNTARPAQDPPIKTSTSREFGSDSKLANRLPRPSTTITTARPSKISAGPNITSKRPETAPKSRAMSTPASALSRDTTASGSTSLRSSASPAPKSRGLSISPVPRSTALTSGLPRPPATRGSAPPTKTSVNAGIADLRARMDKLQARQQSVKAARQG